MKQMTHHPLSITEDALKRALILNGLVLHDDGCAHEVEEPEWAIPLFRIPGHPSPQPIYLEDMTYALRSSLLAAQLSHFQGCLPIKAFSVGKIYDAHDCARPSYNHIEGILVVESMTLREYERFWKRVAEDAFGLGTTVELVALDKNTYSVKMNLDDTVVELALTGRTGALARALLGLDTAHAASSTAWAFTIDIDSVTIDMYGLKGRCELYDPTISKLQSYTTNAVSTGSIHKCRAYSLLRNLGFHEFRGLDVYEADCYKKMNMIQESWDTNNVGVQLVEPLIAYTNLPTVLTPALEEALSVNYQAGEKACRIFEMRHIFNPSKIGGAPTEKVALSFGAYGPDLDKASWKELVSQFLTDLGISNHFFIPTDMAIAYNTSDCWLVMDENMNYLEGNFGSISAKALENHSIDAPAFMAQLEFEPLEKKIEEELNFTPPEFR